MDENENSQQPENGNATPDSDANNPALKHEVGNEDKDWKAEAEKWKHFARTHETNWKKASEELDKLHKASMSDSERAVAEAEERGRKAALESIARERAQLKLEAKAAKAGVELPEQFMDVLDVSKFLTDGDVNEAAISNFVDQFSAQFAQPKGPKFPQGLGIGPQSAQSKPGQLTRADLQRMSHAEIAEADAKGLFDDLKNGLI